MNCKNTVVDFFITARLLRLYGRRAPLVGAVVRDCRGVAAVEFSMVAPLLILMLIGTIDYGVGIYRKMQVQIAAGAGGAYAVAYGFDASAIANAVTSATSFSGVSASPAPTKVCGCPSLSGVATATCSSLCSDGSTPGSYVTVSAQGSYTTLFPYPAIPSSFTFTSQSTVRVQ